MRAAGLIVVAALLAGGCKDFPGADGRYATPSRGGWDNFRAEAPFDLTGAMGTAACSVESPRSGTTSRKAGAAGQD